MTAELLHELADLFDAESARATRDGGASWRSESDYLEGIADEIRRRAYATLPKPRRTKK